MGLAVGMALSGQLQNLAGGVIIVITKPFGIGDFIQAQNVEGTVKSVNLFHTVITTIENKVIFIPNGALSSGVIINPTAPKIPVVCNGLLASTMIVTWIKPL